MEDIQNVILEVRGHPLFTQSLKRCLNIPVEVKQANDLIEEEKDEDKKKRILLVDADFQFEGESEEEKVSGLELMKQLRWEYELPILLTSFQGKTELFITEEIEGLDRYGQVDCFLPKPFLLKDLKERIRECLQPLGDAEEQQLFELRNELFWEWCEKIGKEFRHSVGNTWGAVALLTGAAFQGTVDDIDLAEVASLEILEAQKVENPSLEHRIEKFFTTLRRKIEREKQALETDKEQDVIDSIKPLPEKKVLVVDDEYGTLWRRVLERILEPKGWKVEGDEEGDIQSVLENLPQYDVLLLDINFGPGKELRGLQILEEVQKEYPGFPVVMFTIHNDVRLLESCQEYPGAVDYFAKDKSPIYKRELSVSIDHYNDFMKRLEGAFDRSLYFQYRRELGVQLGEEAEAYFSSAVKWLNVNPRISIYFSGVLHEAILYQYKGKKQVSQILEDKELEDALPYKPYACLLYQIRNTLMHSTSLDFQPIESEAAFSLLLFLNIVRWFNGLSINEQLKALLAKHRQWILSKLVAQADNFLKTDVKRKDADLFSNDEELEEHWEAIWALHGALEGLMRESIDAAQIEVLKTVVKEILFRLCRWTDSDAANSNEVCGGRQLLLFDLAKPESEIVKMQKKIKAIVGFKTSYWCYKPEYESFGIAFMAFFNENVLPLWEQNWDYTDEDAIILGSICVSLTRWYYEVFLERTYPCREGHLKQVISEFPDDAIQAQYSNLQFPDKLGELRDLTRDWLKLQLIYERCPGWFPYMPIYVERLFFKTIESMIYRPKLKSTQTLIRRKENKKRKIESLLDETSDRLQALGDKLSKLKREIAPLEKEAKRLYEQGSKMSDRFYEERFEPILKPAYEEKQTLEAEIERLQFTELELEEELPQIQQTLDVMSDVLSRWEYQINLLNSPQPPIFDFERIKTHINFILENAELEPERKKCLEDIGETFVPDAFDVDEFNKAFFALMKYYGLYNKI